MATAAQRAKAERFMAEMEAGLREIEFLMSLADRHKRAEAAVAEARAMMEHEAYHGTPLDFVAARSLFREAEAELAEVERLVGGAL